MSKHKKLKQHRESAKWEGAQPPRRDEPAVSRRSAFACPRCGDSVSDLGQLDVHNATAHLGA